jgi:hypothetical protein
MATTFSTSLGCVTKNGLFLSFLPFLSGEDRLNRRMIYGGGIKNAD